MDETSNTKIEFAPGCFDDWDGTQEELDELIAEIRRQIDSGEFFENSTKIDIEDLHDAKDRATAEQRQTRH